MSDKILKEVSSYYTEKIIKNGATPQGVDWNSKESQELRFLQLSDVIKGHENFSVIDYGCGFGSMYDFLKKTGYRNFKFIGLDISNKMIEEAKKKHEEDDRLEWFTELPPVCKSDYVIASGIFNVRLNTSEQEWKEYILHTLQKINNIATKGFSFNMLTKYSDKEYMKDYLHYADPLFIFDYCKNHFSKYVDLNHGYPLYEFTIIVRK
jgi:SAM-dependent methyltransferase